MVWLCLWHKLQLGLTECVAAVAQTAHTSGGMWLAVAIICRRLCSDDAHGSPPQYQVVRIKFHGLCLCCYVTLRLGVP